MYGVPRVHAIPPYQYYVTSLVFPEVGDTCSKPPRFWTCRSPEVHFPSHQTLKPHIFGGLPPWIHHPHMVVVHHCFCRWFSLKNFKCYKVATSIATPKKIAKCFEDVVYDRWWYPPICSIFRSFPSSCIGHALLPGQLAKTWFFERSKNAWKEHPAQITKRAQQPQQWAWQKWKLKSWPPACSASVIPLHQLPLQSLGQ